MIADAGVSRKTFYELFRDKEDCFLAAYELWLGRMLSTTAEAYETGAKQSWVDGVQEGLAAFVDFVAQHPAPARFCIVEVLAAGPRAVARRDAGIRQFTYLIDAGRAESSRVSRRSPSSGVSTSSSTARSSTARPRSCRRSSPSWSS